ncbi:MAG: PhoH family protein [Verrucomicrobia bacterium]|nr:PhoH family protein [Verrucomicrobiota bacterium]
MHIPEDQPGLFQEPARQSHLSRTPDSLNGSRTRIKNYVLDTNVLLHDPHSVYRFAENHVWIPIDVLTELDHFKNEQTERGTNARTVHRFLSRCFHQNSKLVMHGAKTPGGGTIRIAVNEFLTAERLSEELRRFRHIFQDLNNLDNRILALCLYVKSRHAERTILITKDLNMQLKALAIGLETQDYENDKVEATDVEGYEQRTIEIDHHALQRFASSRQLTHRTKETAGLHLNEYVFLSAGDNKLVAARHAGDGLFRRLDLPHVLANPRGLHLKPLNLGQQCLLDALLNPDIALVTCYGQAGTGKTLLAVAAGLHLFWSKIFSGLTVSRPVVAMGETLGFLPGTLNEKMKPWLQSIYDAFELLLPSNPTTDLGKRHRKAGPAEGSSTNGTGIPPVKPYAQLIEQGVVEIEALCYIRGRSIPNRYFVLDEAQQLTPLEAKTVITRMSKGSKLVMVGDPAQIDNPYVDSRSNGLVYTRNRLKGQSITAHVCLTKGERSPLAEAGATLM